MEELPDVGSIQPLTEAEKRKAFGTPLQRFLRIDPISVERDPVKRGIASIGSNILDMLNPVATFEEGIQKGSPAMMTIGGLDLVLGGNPYAAMAKLASRPVKALAKKVKDMSPDEVNDLKIQVDDFIAREKSQLEFQKGYQSREEAGKLPGADKADETIKILQKNRQIIFEEPSVNYNKRIAKENKKRLKDNPEFVDDPEALDDLIDEYKGEELFDIDGYVGPDRDFPDIPLSKKSENLSYYFIKEQGYEDLASLGLTRPPKGDLYVGGPDVPTYFEQVGDNKFVIYEPIRDRGRYKRTTLNNPDLRTWRNFLGYAKGGPVDKPLYDDQRMI